MGHNINAAIEDQAYPVEKLRHYKGNPRKHDLNAIEESLRVNGQYRPIIAWESDDPDEHGRVLGGNGTLRVVRDRLGWSHIAVTWWRGDKKAAAKVVAADNQINQLGGFDANLLLAVLKEAGTEGTGYKPADVDKLLAQVSKAEQQKPELEFSLELMESHHYVVLAFDNDLDWTLAQQVLGIHNVKAWDAKGNYQRFGLGRVIAGGPVIQRLNS